MVCCNKKARIKILLDYMMSISHNKYGPIEAILESTESKTVELF